MVEISYKCGSNTISTGVSLGGCGQNRTAGSASHVTGLCLVPLGGGERGQEGFLKNHHLRENLRLDWVKTSVWPTLLLGPARSREALLMI